MPSVRFSRDKRGYEYIYLVHTPVRRGKPGRTRMLYWYRTPPGVRIGRRPFDEEVQRTLERQNPGVDFAWDTIINTPMPAPDMTEFWRERRRAEKAARQERRAVEADSEAAESENSTDDDNRQVVPAFETAPELITTELGASVDAAIAPAEVAGPPENGGDSQSAEEGQGPRKRRRRRGGRRRRVVGGSSVDAPGQEASGDAALESGEPSDTADSEAQSDEDDSASEEQ